MPRPNFAKWGYFAQVLGLFLLGRPPALGRTHQTKGKTITEEMEVSYRPHRAKMPRPNFAKWGYFAQVLGLFLLGRPPALGRTHQTKGKTITKKMKVSYRPHRAKMPRPNFAKWGYFAPVLGLFLLGRPPALGRTHQNKGKTITEKMEVAYRPHRAKMPRPNFAKWGYFAQVLGIFLLGRRPALGRTH
ncbi:hypothetical protein LOTGIDRAFT_174329 [Lottia gigantea]|uniref:Uncharacterized protein n=1 Tax=Lottia gigantea TaxID=225164 RepID=V4ALZ9_LOTGI|nr:hypothetical protein LOTGIDRAFT_174329 [Lottia gigantea]ESO98152.1 hypothetical protein LOTGIDRAFT_174329 [Lottia gigantea]